MAEIRRVSVDEMRTRAAALFAEHWAEIATHKHLMQVKPDWARYEELELRGMLLALAAFEGESMLGYSVSLMVRHPHYDMAMAINDLLFLAKARRQGSLGLRLIRETEQTARALGAKLLLWPAKERTNLAELCPRLGYRVQDIVFSKEL